MEKSKNISKDEEELLRKDRELYIDISRDQSNQLDKGILIIAVATFNLAFLVVKDIPTGCISKFFGIALFVLAISTVLTLTSFYASEKSATCRRESIDTALQNDDLEKLDKHSRWYRFSQVLNFFRYLVFAIGMILLAISIAIWLWR